MLRAAIRKIPDVIVYALTKAFNDLSEPSATADPGALTDSTGGSVDGTLAAISGSGADAAINNNFADLADRVNKLRALFYNKHAAVTTKASVGDYTDPTSTADTITSATATDTATAITMVNEAKAVINRHFADTLAHKSAVSAAIATADATDEATAITLANAIKSAYNTHRSAANVHFENDAGNEVTSTNASDEASLVTLVNEIKTDFNAHVVLAPMAAKIELVSA